MRTPRSPRPRTSLPATFLVSTLLLAAGAVATVPDRAARGVDGPDTSWLEVVVADHEVTDERPDLALVEPQVSVDPNDPRHLVAGTIVAAPNRSEGPWHCAALASFDGGRTWSRRDFELQRCIDPWTLITEDGITLAAFVEIRDDGEGDERFRLLVYRSTDGGRTWGEPMDLGRAFEHPTLAVGPDGDVLLAGRRTRYPVDATERFAFNLYAAAADGTGFRERADVIVSNLRNSPSGVVTLADGTLVTTVADGARWEDDEPIDHMETRRTWALRSREQPEAGCQEPVVRASVDGGETFLPAVTPADEPSCPDNPANGTVADSWSMGGDYNSFAVGPDGTFHAVWADARSGPFRLRHSSFRIAR